MEAIDQFDVEVDISDRERLYDYVTCTLLKRPEDGKWDQAMFKGMGTRDCIPDDDENAANRVLLMDRSLHDKGCLEKKMKDEKKGEKESESEGLDDEREDRALPRRVMPVYKPGEVVKGNVILQLNQPVNAESLLLNFLGEAFMNIRIYHRYGYYDYPKHETWVDETRTLWKRVDSAQSDVSDSFALLTTSDGTVQSAMLSPGNHSFPFFFVIPETARQSTPPLIQRNDHRGYVFYRLRAKIDTGKTLSSGSINSHKAIWVETPYDIARDPQNLEPAISEEITSTGPPWKTGNISLRATLPRAGILIGEPANITLEVNNHSGGTIAMVTACIHMTGRTQTSRKKMAMKHNINIKSVKCTAENIGAGMCPAYKWLIPWDFSPSNVDGNLLPVGTLDDCDLIDVRYEIKVKVTRKGLHRKIDMVVPITVGNFSSVEGTFDSVDTGVERVFYSDD